MAATKTKNDHEEEFTNPQTTSAPSNSRKRLSRREQKARKKQRLQHEKQHQEPPVLLPSNNNNNDNNDHNGEGTASKPLKKSKKKKRKKKKKSSSLSTAPESSAAATQNAATADSADKPTDSQSSTTTAPATPSLKPHQVQDDIPYMPTPLVNPTDSKTDATTRPKHNTNDKTLGRWFPKARVIKSQPSTSDQCTILLFYQYKSPQVWNPRQVHHLIQYLQQIAHARPTLGGRLRVAPEGINATLSCGDVDGVNSRTILEHFTKDLQQFDAVFEQTDYKYITAKADRHFKDLKILPVQELVFYGLDESQAPLCETGVHLDPKDFHQMLHDTSKETVVIDVRNHYEAALGRFDGQEKQHATKKKEKEDNDEKDGTTPVGGAKYIDPEMRKSTDFPAWVEKAADDLKGKRVMMYCTGGVRCERASAYLKKTLGDQLDGVYQLQGGIERYLQAFPGGGYWTGRNFVFDKRESVSADNPNGDGGVLAKKKKTKTKTSINDNDDIKTNCCLCDKPWDRYVGKKKCETCGVPVLMCDTCMSTQYSKKKLKERKLSVESDNHNTSAAVSDNHKKKADANDNDNDNDKKENNAQRKMARCPLCVEQNITVPVEEVEYTDNGVKIKSHSDQGKAAPSVLKWGGGVGKKHRRRALNQTAAADQELMEG